MKTFIKWLKEEGMDWLKIMFGFCVFAWVFYCYGQYNQKHFSMKDLTEKEWEQTKDGQDVFNRLKESGLEVIDNLTEENEQLKEKIAALEEQINLMSKEKKPIIRKWGDKISPDGKLFSE